ncbi:MAG: hypothetical protein KA715_09255 [Xanthomonadaceae bacterium]|nr:hypothetical protein [Xanthomonadaceae bacterium]
MKDIKRFFFILYPSIILSLMLFVSVTEKSHAGVMRKVELSPGKSAIVRVALKRVTILPFLSRPEKVVPGSPESLEINFLGKDLSIRPLSHEPGNLIIYTKAGRYVVLLHMADKYNYDDVVEITSSHSKRRINLLHDTYKNERRTDENNNRKIQMDRQTRS